MLTNRQKNDLDRTKHSDRAYVDCPVWCSFLIRSLLLLSFLLVLLAIWIAVGGDETYSRSADAAIVLGAAVWDGVPSPVFEERINHAIDLYRTGMIQYIVFTGGVGDGDQLSESEVAKAYAIERGVAAGDIYCETTSTITWENLKEARRVVEEAGWCSVVIVSDPLHMRRAVTMARDLGMDAYPSPTPTSRYRTWRTKTGFLVRETVFYALYLARRRLLWLTS